MYVIYEDVNDNKRCFISHVYTYVGTYVRRRDYKCLLLSMIDVMYVRTL